MTNGRMVAVLAATCWLALGGCSKDEGAETTERAVTEGGETTTTTTVEEWRAEEELPADERVVDEGIVATPSMVDPRMQGAAKGAIALSDGEIAKIIEVVNQKEIDQGELAKTKASDPDVRKFAQHMIAEHSRAKQRGAKLVMQQQLITQDNTVATDLSIDANETLESLRGAHGAEFDLMYMESQVEQHERVLDLLEKELIPAADSQELKAELEHALKMVERHRNEAHELKLILAEEQDEP